MSAFVRLWGKLTCDEMLRCRLVTFEEPVPCVKGFMLPYRKGFEMRVSKST
jgi:hypothetical protein